VPKSQTGSDIEKQDQKHQSQHDESESQQPPENGTCRECRVKMAQIDNLELELEDQEGKARRHEEAAIRHERRLANAHVIGVRQELSTRINELEAQQSGQTSTSEDPRIQHRSAYYYCDDCCHLQMKLGKAREKIRDSEDKASRRKDEIRGLKYWLDEARERSRELREDLNAANEEIARLRAELGLRTSKL
jgi:chromosome segregation ATPase